MTRCSKSSNTSEVGKFAKYFSNFQDTSEKM